MARRRIRAERVLLATGRHPALESLHLDAVGVAPNEQGRLEIGEDMRVHGSQHIFAAGDVAGLRMVVHHAHIEAGHRRRECLQRRRPPLDEALKHPGDFFRPRVCLCRNEISRRRKLPDTSW